MSILAFDDVSRHFGRRPVLQGLNLSVADGETVLLRGPNGSGKTTLLRLAATTLAPTSGSVRVAGETGAAARRHLAFVPHDAPLYRELNALEHIQFATRLHGQSISRGDALRMLRDAGLAKQAHRPTATLSRGQRQRVALATAFAVQPALLLLDEPFTALDDDGRAWAETQLAARDGAALVSVHGPTNLAPDRTLELVNGGIA